MKTKFIVTALLGAASAVLGQEPKTPIDLGSVAGRIDHFSADVAGGRIFVSALGNRTVEVVDVRAGKVLHSIADLAEPQGVYYDPASSRLFVACAGDGAVKIYDGATYRLLDTVKLSADSDNIRYDARGRRVIVGYGDGALAFLDAAGKRSGEIPLDAHPESFQLEKTGTRVFVNVPDRKEIEVADVEKKAIIARWPVTSALRNFPMAFDEAHHRLFVGCRAPARMLVLDAAGGRQMDAVDIPGDTDDLFYDASANRVYVIGGAGFVDAFEQKEGGRFTRIAHLATAPGARTGLLVPEWKQLFVAAPRRGGQHARVLVYETK